MSYGISKKIHKSYRIHDFILRRKIPPRPKKKNIVKDEPINAIVEILKIARNATDIEGTVSILTGKV